MKTLDRRTEKQKKESDFFVVAVDKFMSGWGEAEDGNSVCAWGCRAQDLQWVLDWVRARKEMTRVRIVPDEKTLLRRLKCAHLAIEWISKPKRQTKKKQNEQSRHCQRRPSPQTFAGR